jgi:RNA polymerase II subunit A-like phosphatase
VKVDAARRRGGIKIVWLAWFTDSVALWQHQDETHYFLDEPSTSTAPLPAPESSPTTSSQQISSEPEPDTDEWDAEPGEPPGTLELNDINWNDINDEVEAAMNESDDEEEATSKKGAIASEDEWTDESIRCVERFVRFH